jgi:chromosome partitioning protein
LLIDLDSQGNLSQIFNVATENGQVFNSLVNYTIPMHIEEVTENLHIAPSDLELQKAEQTLLSAPASQQRLQRALVPFLDVYDFILIDCPPSLSVLDTQCFKCSQFMHCCYATRNECGEWS